MKRILLFALATLFCQTLFSQANLRSPWITRLEPNSEFTYSKNVVKWNNGYLTTETTQASLGDTKGILRKFDSRGRQQWSRTYQGNGNVEINCITATSDGGFVMAGRTLSTEGIFSDNPVRTQFDYEGYDNYVRWSWVMKFNRHGRLQWKKYYPNGIASDITEDTDGSLILLTNLPEGDYNMWFNQLDGRNGNTILLIESGLLTQYRKWGKSVVATPDAYLILAEFQSSDTVFGNHGYPGDYFLFKFTKTPGYMISFMKCYGGTLSDKPYDLKSTPDGGFLMTGCSESNDGDVSATNSTGTDVWTLKVDSNGNILWQDKFGGNSHDMGLSLIVNEDGSSVVCANTVSDDSPFNDNGYGNGMVIKYSENGTREWMQTYGGNGYEWAEAIAPAENKSFVIFGHSFSTQSSDGNFSQPGGFLMKFKENNVPHNPLRIEQTETGLSPYPNPCDSRFSLMLEQESTVELYDLNGRLALPSANGLLGLTEIRTDLLHDGLYILRVTSNGTATTKRIIVSHR